MKKLAASVLGGEGAALARSEPATPRPERSSLGLATGNEAESKLFRLARRQLDRLVELEPKALKGRDPEAIHDFRVATRRLEAVLELLFETPLPADLKRHLRPIKRSRKAFSETRDLDALEERVGAILARKRARRRQAWVVARRYLARRRKEAIRRAQKKVRGASFREACVELRELLNPSELASRGSNEAILERGKSLNERIRSALERSDKVLERRFARVNARAKPREIHAARIAAKQARYGAEALRVLDVPHSAEMVARLRELQRLLGHWHDLEQLENVLIEALARPSFLRAHLKTALEIGRLLSENRRQKTKLLTQFPQRARELLDDLRFWLDQDAAPLVEDLDKG